VVVHIDAELLASSAGGDRDAAGGSGRPGQSRACHLDDAAPLAIETARRLCCDAGIVPVVREGDRTLAVGRRTRAIPPSIRRALRLRQPCCAFPGCTRTRWLDAHHVVHWAHGGSTDLRNLVQLCRHHHRLVHEGGWTLRADSRGDLDVRRPDGRRLVAVPDAVPNDAGRAAAPHAAPAVSDAARALTPLSAGERYDLDLTIDALLAWTRPPTPAAAASTHDDHALAA
jgi:hypothetical protein